MVTPEPRKEFWRDIKPLENVFRKDAAPEIFLPDTLDDDERYFIPLSETVGWKV